MPLQISNEVMQVLERAAFDGPRLQLTGQLDRKLYEATSKVIESAGGKWNRGAKAHVFDGDAADLMDDILQTGEYHRVKQDLGQFDTPQAVVARVMELVGDLAGKRVLEPNAGIGALAIPAIKAGAIVDCIEIDPARLQKISRAVEHLPSLSVLCRPGDFLVMQPPDRAGHDVVIMNPPFAKQADIQHVLHASRFVKPGGRLVAVMSASVTFRQNRAAVVFRQFVEEHEGSIEMLDPGAFAESGTMVRACIVTVKL